MTLQITRNALLATTLLVCTSCGGESGGGGSTPVSLSPTPGPTPTPTASPTPEPPPFEPVLGQLYEGPNYNDSLVVLGKGYTYDHRTYLTGSWDVTNAADADDFTVAFDQTLGGYRMSAALAGTGMLYRVSEIAQSVFPDTAVDSYNAVVADSQSAARGAQTEITITPGGSGNRFQYVAIAMPWLQIARNSTTSSMYFGNFGVAQPTLPADEPEDGSADYSGFLYGFFDEDAGGTGLFGEVALSVDFAQNSVNGNLTTEFWCFMGCSYPAQAFELRAGEIVDDHDFSGGIVKSGLPSEGHFDGIFAGPNAAELVMRVEFPYYNNDLNRWMMFGGIIVAKRD